MIDVTALQAEIRDRVSPEPPLGACIGIGAIYVVPSATRPWKAHMVVHFADGRWACSCEARTECWHIREVIGGSATEVAR